MLYGINQSTNLSPVRKNHAALKQQSSNKLAFGNGVIDDYIIDKIPPNVSEFNREESAELFRDMIGSRRNCNALCDFAQNGVFNSPQDAGKKLVKMGNFFTTIGKNLQKDN